MRQNLMALTGVEHLHQPLVQMAVGVRTPQLRGLRQTFARVSVVNQVPRGEVEKHAAGHLTPTGAGVPQAQVRHDTAQVQQAVKVGAADVDASGGQHVICPVGFFLTFGAELNHGEIGGAPADVHHQHGGVLVDPAFKVKRRGNGFQLKADRLKSGGPGSAFQRGLRQRVAVGMVIDKMHRTPQHGRAHLKTEVPLGPRLEFLEKEHHDVKKSH